MAGFKQCNFSEYLGLNFWPSKLKLYFNPKFLIIKISTGTCKLNGQIILNTPKNLGCQNVDKKMQAYNCVGNHNK